MIRIVLAFFALLSFSAFGQLVSSASTSADAIGTLSDTTGVDSLNIVADFVPVPKSGGWVWYDIANDRPSDSIHITDCILPKSGFSSEFVLKNDSMWGILRGEGSEIQPFIYDSIIYIDKQLITLSDGVWSYHYETLSELESELGELVDSLIPITFDSLFYDGMELYLFHEGKTGMILKTGSVISPKYDGIHHFSCHSKSQVSIYYMTLLEGKYNLLNNLGEELLPDDVWDLRCTEDGVYEFRRDENPEFYIPYMDEFLRPNGRDVIFYEQTGYKLYNSENTRSEFHLIDGTVLKDQFDDYFYLTDDFFAVRLNGKVGLTQNGTELLSELKYDQINPVYETYFSGPLDQAYFKFYSGDSCGLMDQYGSELFDANYANIHPTGNSERFIVVDQERTGVVDRQGEIILPVKYDYIYLDHGTQLFIVENNQKLGLFRLDGSKKLPIEYNLCRALQSFGVGESSDGLLLLEKGGKFYFTNRTEFISSKGFNHFDHTRDILKTYDSQVITVFIFDSIGKVEEKQEYPLYQNTIIKRNYWDYNYGFNGWHISELEENQSEGYFGLRYHAKRGMGVKPTYRTVRPTSFQDFIGAVDVDLREYSWTDELTAEIIGGFDHLKTGVGSVDNDSFFSSDLLSHFGGAGDRYINVELDGTQVRSYKHLNKEKTIDLSKRILYSEHESSNHHLRKYFAGGSVEMCSIESAALSLYDYFAYWNSLDACRVTPELMKEILNPKLGVRFVNSQPGIINASWSWIGSHLVSFESTRYFEEFNFIGRSLYFERPLNSATGSIKSIFLPEKDEESTAISNVIAAQEADTYLDNFVIAQVKSSQIAKIHIDFPNYFFYQDSLYLSYETGRITRRLDSNFVRLITPSGSIVADSCQLIRYLNEDRFAIYRSKGWELIDKNGKLITETKFANVSEFNNDRAEFSLKDGSAVVINANGEELMPLPEPRKFIDDDHYYFASNPAVIINQFSHVKDQAGVGEKYASNGFFISKEDGLTRIRRFGTPLSIEVKLQSKLKSFGSCLYYNQGKHMYSIDSNLVTTKHKKIEKLRVVTPEIGWLQGKKEQLIDSDWSKICTMSKKERFEMKDGRLIVFENDSVFRDFGTMKPGEDGSVTADEIPPVKVISENGKYGVQRGEKVLLPTRYSWLSKINDQEFLTKIGTENQLFDPKLKRIGNQPFDRYIQTVQLNFVFFYKDQTYVILNGEEGSRIIQP